MKCVWANTHTHTGETHMWSNCWAITFSWRGRIITKEPKLYYNLQEQPQFVHVMFTLFDVITRCGRALWKWHCYDAPKGLPAPLLCYSPFLIVHLFRLNSALLFCRYTKTYFLITPAHRTLLNHFASLPTIHLSTKRTTTTSVGLFSGTVKRARQNQTGYWNGLPFDQRIWESPPRLGACSYTGAHAERAFD